ncbi:MAG: polysaccharide deacetylase family protein [Candidatus Gottesmanbacteria bacterium]
MKQCIKKSGNISIIIILSLLLIICLSLLGWQTFSKVPITKKLPPETKIASDSALAKDLAEAKKKAEEEAKKKEEERQFMATYGPCYWLPILMYHHVNNQSGWLYVSPETFASQMDYLIQKGYQTITLSDAVNFLNSGQFPGKVVVLTFDDGYRDFFDQAYPILRQRNLKATVFLITQLMEGADYLTWQQAREMAGSGLITLGDHTLDHKSLSSLSADQIKNEVVNSKSILESQLGMSVNVFCYPYGGYNQATVNSLSENGFIAAVTTQSGLNCAKLPLTLRRVRVGGAQLSSYGL